MPTTKIYNGFTRKKQIRQFSVQLDDDATGHWLGNENAENVLLWFHGTGLESAIIESVADGDEKEADMYMPPVKVTIPSSGTKSWQHKRPR
jgi:hypothetical protein